MTKILVASVTALILSTSAFAAKTFKPCSPAEVKDLKKTVTKLSFEGYKSSLLVNLKNETIGFFGFNGSEAHAEVCEYLGIRDITAANEWFYWDSEEVSPNPATWPVGKTLQISQDEGIAKFKILSASRAGKPVVEMTAFGWGDSGKYLLLKKETVTFSK